MAHNFIFQFLYKFVFRNKHFVLSYASLQTIFDSTKSDPSRGCYNKKLKKKRKREKKKKRKKHKWNAAHNPCLFKIDVYLYTVLH